MKLPVKISVTTQDIKTGNRFDAGACPVAKALRRTTGEGFVFAWRNGEALIGGKKFRLPEKAEKFIDEFDHNPEHVRHNMSEFTFVIKEQLSFEEAEVWFFSQLRNN